MAARMTTVFRSYKEGDQDYLLYKNQVIRSELRETRSRLRDIEVLLFGPESHSPCLYTQAEVLLVVRSVMASSSVNTLGLGIESFSKQDQ